MKCTRCGLPMIGAALNVSTLHCRCWAYYPPEPATTGPVSTDADSVRRELLALARRDVITDRDRVLIGAAIGLIGKGGPNEKLTWGARSATSG